MSSKVKLDEVGLTRMVLKVKGGLCCLEGCERNSELMYMSSNPPYLCEYHIENPSDDAHPGEYLLSSDRTYSSQASHKWTCCGGTWRLGHCSVLARAFEAVASEIPVSEAQRERLAAKERAADEAWRERDRQEAIDMANDNYCWDRS